MEMSAFLFDFITHVALEIVISHVEIELLSSIELAALTINLKSLSVTLQLNASRQNVSVFPLARATRRRIDLTLIYYQKLNRIAAALQLTACTGLSISLELVSLFFTYR